MRKILKQRRFPRTLGKRPSNVAQLLRWSSCHEDVRGDLSPQSLDFAAICEEEARV
jgi:hypothetical protein